MQSTQANLDFQGTSVENTSAMHKLLLLLQTFAGASALDTESGFESRTYLSATLPVIRRASLSVYGWGGWSWDGGDDPHGYGNCDQLRRDLRVQGANSECNH